MHFYVVKSDKIGNCVTTKIMVFIQLVVWYVGTNVSVVVDKSTTTGHTGRVIIHIHPKTEHCLSRL
jgi:hypothetical protein